jgi:hypothetical protein
MVASTGDAARKRRIDGGADHIATCENSVLVPRDHHDRGASLRHHHGLGDISQLVGWAGERR